ncbi:MAG: MBL fold metallo-hydrolase [Verrucomicrobia bacterium]|nr:MBL fold metallo-hydrolase [Verrucomicrobiota bacterium]
MTPIPQPLPLEDAWNDVLGKAVRGTGIDEKNLAASANIIPSQLKSILGGERPSEDTLRRLAIAVGLRPGPFLDLAFQRYQPAPFDAARWPGVVQVPTRYMDMIVNSYLVWDAVSREAALFDTGADLAPARAIIERERLKLSALCITHMHGDHIAVLDDVLKTYRPRFYAPKDEPAPNAPGGNAILIEEGAEISIGALKGRALLTDGHSAGHLTYVFTAPSGWPAPVAVVGDALFAGSMGGGVVSYSRLRDNVRNKILTLPPATLLCPGHGPTTTVGEEDEHNSFA